MSEPNVEEVLELIWTLEEEIGKVDRAILSEQMGVEAANAILEDMNKGGFVNFKDNQLILSPIGRRNAELVIRRHRLAERLLHDILEVRGQASESSACEFEHFLSEEVTTSICTLLGHPRSCPHGKRIPPGECCLRAEKDVKPLVLPLADLRSGDEAKIAYISTDYHSRLDKLSSMGLVPGVSIRVHQRQPSFVIQVGEMQIALDKNIARDIYVRLLNSNL